MPKPIQLIRIGIYDPIKYSEPIYESSHDNAINTENRKKLEIKYSDTGAPKDINPDNLFVAETNYGNQVSNFGTSAKLAESRKIEFLLKQELLYALNVFGYGNIVNPLAVLNQIPFAQGDIHTSLEYDISSPLGVDKLGINIGSLLPSTRYIPKPMMYITSTGINSIKIKTNTPKKIEPDNQLDLTLDEVEAQQPLTSPGSMVKNLLLGSVKSIIGDIKDKALNNIQKDVSKNLTKQINTQIKPSFNSYEKLKFQQETIGDESSIDLNVDVKGVIDTTTLEQIKNRNAFPFYFSSLNYNDDSLQKNVFFRAIINNVSEVYSPSWNQDDVFGRVHPIWVYSNVNRTINIEFVIVALQKNIKQFKHPNPNKNSSNPTDYITDYEIENLNELDYLRQKVNWISKHTYPAFTKASDNFINFKSGPFIQMTVGNLFKKLNGFISSLELDWNYTKRWDIVDFFPQGVKVTMRFNVLEEKLIQNSDDETENNQITSLIYEPFGQ